MAVVAAEQPGDRLAARLAQQIPKSDIDTGNNMFERAAASLPKDALPQLLAHPFRLDGRFAFPMLPQRRHPGLDERRVREHAANASQPLVGNHLDQGVQVVLGLMALGPASVHGAA